MCMFFFFQAEDGIRDKLVTGVQTCALPISATRRANTCGAACRWKHAAELRWRDDEIRWRSSQDDVQARRGLAYPERVGSRCTRSLGTRPRAPRPSSESRSSHAHQLNSAASLGSDAGVG